jgi:hypothetical protein
MQALTDTILDEEVPRAQLALLLQHFSKLDDGREPWRVLYPLKEVLRVVVCATIARTTHNVRLPWTADAARVGRGMAAAMSATCACQTEGGRRNLKIAGTTLPSRPTFASRPTHVMVRRSSRRA